MAGDGAGKVGLSQRKESTAQTMKSGSADNKDQLREAETGENSSCQFRSLYLTGCFATLPLILKKETEKPRGQVLLFLLYR